MHLQDNKRSGSYQWTRLCILRKVCKLSFKSNSIGSLILFVLDRYEKFLTEHILQPSCDSRRFMCAVFIKSIVEMPDLHKYVETTDKRERDATLATFGLEPIIWIHNFSTVLLFKRLSAVESFFRYQSTHPAALAYADSTRINMLFVANKQ